MGPSGSGKSTLLFVLGGADAADGGCVRFRGRELSALGENELADLRRTAIGFVFQQPMMLAGLNILDNILLPAARLRREPMKALAARARLLMEKTGIAGLENRSIGQVSGGQLQRAAICRALINRPDIVLADEPTGALHSRAAQDVMDLFAEINREGTAILLVTHDVRVAARTRRVLFLLDGKIRRGTAPAAARSAGHGRKGAGRGEHGGAARDLSRLVRPAVAPPAPRPPFPRRRCRFFPRQRCGPCLPAGRPLLPPPPPARSFARLRVQTRSRLSCHA